MARHRIRPAACSIATGALAASVCGVGAAREAPEADTERASYIAEIIVTAQKREESANDVPMSITAVNAQQLASREITTVQDLTRVVPGFSYVVSGANTPIYSLRGIGFSDSSVGARPSVSLYLDEVSLPFSAMTIGTNLDLERVEVLKGPQGTLYGQNSTGGAINYVAARPTSTFEAGTDIGFGNFDAWEVGGFLSGPLSETVSARLAIKTQQSDGWQESTTREDEQGARDFTMGRASMEWKPSDRLSARLTVNGFLDRSDTQAPALLELDPNTPAAVPLWPLLLTLEPAPRDNRAADWDADADFSRDNTFYQGAARLDYQLGSATTLTSITSYGRYDFDQLTESDGVFLQNFRGQLRGYAESAAQELRLAGDSERVRWVAGLNYSEDETLERTYHQNQYSTAVTAFGGNINDVAGFTRQDFQTSAVFGNVDVDLTEQVTLHAGARYTKADLSYSACAQAISAPDDWTFLFNLLRSFGGFPPLAEPIESGDCVTLDSTLTPGIVRGELNEDNVSWRAGLDWSPNDDLLLYANVSRGYKAGSAPTIAALQDAQTDPVTQESVLAYEAGFKASLLGLRLQLNGAAFLYDYRNKQLRGRKAVTPNIVGPIGALVNVPESEIRGAELQLDWYPHERWVVNLGATYLESEVTDSFVNIGPTAIVEDFEGNSFPYTPDLQYSANAEYRFPLGATLRAFVGAAVTYRSETTAGFGTDPRIQIDEYSLLDARAGIESADGTWRAGIWGKNLTDEYYWSNVVYTSDVIVRYTGMPRTFGVRLSYRFQ